LYLFVLQAATITMSATLVSKSRTLLYRSSRPAAAAFRAFGSSSEYLVKTALNDLHKELGGDMVPFAGYELPVLYKGTENGGVMKEHLWCRDAGKSSLFDVSHMGQVR
jgi:aminomethyltransferase